MALERSGADYERVKHDRLAFANVLGAGCPITERLRMYGDNGVLVNLEEISKVIAAADVVAIGFAQFPERVLIDARANEEELPLVQVVDPAGSPRERLAWLYRRRPSLAPPHSVSFVAWPHSPALLVQSGVWEDVRRRVGADTEPEVGAQCDLALKQVQNLDVTASLAILKGENCVNLWPRQGVQEGRV